MDINLEYYKIFYYVSKLGRITLAAEELSLSQPAVSQAIKQLENRIGMPLFVRTGKGVRLTSAGEILYRYVQKGYETILLGERKMKEMNNLESGEIRIGASDMTLQFYLLPYLKKFHELYPKVKLNVTNGPTPVTMRYMQEGKIDFGVVTEPVNGRGEVKMPMHYVVYPVGEVEDVFVAGIRFFELRNRMIPLKELEELPIICLERNTSSRRYMDEFMEENGVQLNPEIELATSDMIVQFARNSLGIASVVRDFAVEYLDKGELFELKLQKKIPKRSICIVQDSGNPLSAAAQKLIDMMELVQD